MPVLHCDQCQRDVPVSGATDWIALFRCQVGPGEATAPLLLHSVFVLYCSSTCAIAALMAPVAEPERR
jgi:hypothetical protein